MKEKTKKNKQEKLEEMINEERYWRRDWNEELLERKEHLEKLIKNKSLSISRAPEGCLRVKPARKSFQYYRVDDPKNPNGMYLPQKEITLARKLAQKSYDQKIIRAATKELKIVNDYLSFQNEHQLSGIYYSLAEGRRELVKPISLTDEQYIGWWKSVKYESYEIEDNEEFFFTESGIRVRSKSELIIGNALERYGIPYRYEFPLILWDNSNVRPDFYCLNVRERREKVWEHFGMMDDPDYANKNVRKISNYEMSGYHADSNFIMTFETSKVPICSKIIDEKIEAYLL